MSTPSDRRIPWHFEPLPALLRTLDVALRDARAFDNCARAIERCVRARERHGDYERWRRALEGLPAISAAHVDLGSAAVRIGSNDALDARQRQALARALRALCPWRKGPFEVFGNLIDAEWRCDQKWQRAARVLTSLHGRRILDVGCGNGYYCLRALGAGARTVLGIDPSLLFVMQFEALRRLMPPVDAHILPLTLEQLPRDVCGFDTVFSFGVLYHRRSPSEHLGRLREALLPGGQLALETLVVTEGSASLVPDQRYANMRNVYIVPTLEHLTEWLEAAGYCDITIADVTRTTNAEQRQTAWMPFHSLDHALDPTDERRTVEGYPAPTRALVLATRA